MRHGIVGVQSFNPRDTVAEKVENIYSGHLQLMQSVRELDDQSGAASGSYIIDTFGWVLGMWARVDL